MPQTEQSPAAPKTLAQWQSMLPNTWIDLPYACKGGVCATCKCKVLRGKVAMETNYSLEPDELAAGYVLSCQALPLTSDVVVDFDAKGMA